MGNSFLLPPVMLLAIIRIGVIKIIYVKYNIFAIYDCESSIVIYIYVSYSEES